MGADMIEMDVRGGMSEDLFVNFGIVQVGILNILVSTLHYCTIYY